MTRPRWRVELLGASVVVALGIAVVIIALGSSSQSSTRPATSAQPTAVSFADSYLAYLSGGGSAQDIVDATPQVRRIVASAGPIPAEDRRGTLRLHSVTMSAVTGAPHAQAVVAGAQPGLSLQAGISLSYVGSRWRVSGLVPPDLDTLLGSHVPVAPVAPALRRAATRFAVAYVDFRAHTGPRPAAIAPTLAAQLSAGQDPLARTPVHGHAALARLSITPDGSLASAAATVSIAGRRLTLSFNLDRIAGTWRAWEFPEATS